MGTSKFSADGNPVMDYLLASYNIDNTESWIRLQMAEPTFLLDSYQYLPVRFLPVEYTLD